MALRARKAMGAGVQEHEAAKSTATHADFSVARVASPRPVQLRAQASTLTFTFT